MLDCIFCQIIQGHLPCAKIYEDDQVLSFLDINPVTTGHAIVVPKQHYSTIFHIPPEDLEACIVAAKRVGTAVFKGVGASGLNVLQNNYRAAGQMIDHFHLHLIPRHAHDGFLTSWPGRPYPTGELDKILKKILPEV